MDTCRSAAAAAAAAADVSDCDSVQVNNEIDEAVAQYRDKQRGLEQLYQLLLESCI